MKFKFIISAFTAVLLGSSFAIADAPKGVPEDYPLTKCPVSDDKLGEHGKAVKATTTDGTDVYLCCRDCLKDFNKDPEKYGKLVKEASEKK